MTQTIAPVRPAERESSGAHLAFTASVVISTVGIFVSLVGFVWANVQRVDYDDLDLTGVFSGAEEGFSYVAVYLTAMLLAGLLALFLAMVGASAVRHRAWIAVVAGAMAMFLVMVPVVFVAGHEANHWGGCTGCVGGGGD
jgi:ABC-type Fe3+ transport system permease subunit